MIKKEKEKKELTNEEKYLKLELHEQIIKRPDTYIGSVEANTENYYIFNKEKNKFEKKKLNIVAGWFKIFDEILVNACDNKTRDKNMKYLKINIDKEKGSIIVKNDGESIPIEIHKKEKIWIPEMIFGNLLTGTNFVDGDEKITGGKNGYGAKLANIFSLNFILRVGNKKNKKECVIEWEENMFIKKDNIIQKNKNVKDYVEIEFYPDFEKFGIKELGDHFKLFERRVYDVKGCFGNKLKVYFNDEEIKIKNFLEYSKLYVSDDVELFRDKQKEYDWEVIVGLTGGKFEQVSFVNSISTYKGGKHVNWVLKQIINKLTEHIQKKYKKFKIKKHSVKNYFSIFINCKVINPNFSSQTKEELISNVNNKNFIISDEIIEELIKTDIVTNMINNFDKSLESKLLKENKKGKRNRLIGIDKLEDANLAGSKNSDQCTLILTEGDSAKSLAMAGISVIGRDRYGVFPLKGKFINVRDKKLGNVISNPEVKSLLKILGLQINNDDKDNKSLRYGKVMIMADQDTDGSHIKGLVINFFHNYWPELIKNNNFLKQFVTPLIKCKKGKEIESFFSVSDFEKWKNTINDFKKWSIKYYKGLGTSDNKEGKEYFSELGKHEKKFIYESSKDEEDIILAFDKKKQDYRKEWIGNHKPENIINYVDEQVTYSDFINKELIHFSIEDNSRSIASLCDGLKPGSRKILFACFKRKLTKEIKVAQLSGYVAEHSAYHHGEASLQSTIVNLAQNFVGSNNINLWEPNGQFGSRLAGGKDHASARYIHTNLSKITRLIFKEEDDHVVEYLEDDGQKVEPKFYIPIIPMSLINGCQGIGTGWSTFIPNYNPEEIVEIIKKKILNKNYKFKRINPFYKNFKGKIDTDFDKNKISINGIIEYIKNENILNITELPIGTWTDKYKKTVLEEFIKKDKYLNDFEENHTTNEIDFIIKLKNEVKDIDLKQENLLNNFKIKTTQSLSNLVLFNEEGKIFKYNSEIDILKDFFKIRLKFYEKRKEYLISKIKRENVILTNKMNFIQGILDENIKINKQKKKQIADQLHKLNFIKYSNLPKIKSTKENYKDEVDNVEKNVDLEPHMEYNYLLSMNFWSLTEEQIEKLKNDLNENTNKLKFLEKQTIEEMWVKDLDEFIKKLNEIEELEKKELNEVDKNIKKKGNKGKKKGNKKITKNNKNEKKKKSKNKIKKNEEEKKSKSKIKKNEEEKKSKSKIKKKNEEKEKKNKNEISNKPLYLDYYDDLIENYFDEELFVNDLKNFFDKNELIEIDDKDLNPIQIYLKNLVLKKENSKLEMIYNKKEILGVKNKKRKKIKLNDSEIDM